MMDAKVAVEKYMREGAVVGVGGMHMHNNPMALIREIIRQRKMVGTLVTSPSGSINADMLIGSGLVDTILTSYVGFEHLGLAPNFRSSVESKKVKLRDVDEGFIVYGLRAGSSSLPFMTFPEGIVTDLPAANPDDYKHVTDPFSGKRYLCAKAIQPDLSIIHCQKADEYGNAIFEGSVFTDFEMLKASDKVILQVEEVVPNEYIIKHRSKAMVPAFLVDAVVRAPFGCHPTASHNYYTYDEEHFKMYMDRTKTDFPGYLDSYVFQCKSHDEYIEKVGREKLKSLVEGV